MTRLVGTANGIDLIIKEDGTEMYYSQKTGKCAMNMRGIARMLDCQPKSILNIGVKLGLWKKAELYTQGGIQGVTFIVESDLPKLLEAITKSRMKKQTRDNAQEKLNAFAQAGFRLMVLLEIAPEIVAREAINHINSPKVADQVAQDASLHGQYLRSHISINYEAEKNELKAGKIVGENNLALGLPYSGGRHKANNNQKATLTVTQLDQSSVLNAIRNSEQDVSKEDRYAACEDVREIYAENRKAVNAIMDKYRK